MNGEIIQGTALPCIHTSIQLFPYKIQHNLRLTIRDRYIVLFPSLPFKEKYIEVQLV